MGDRRANPSDWNRDYNMGTGRGPFMFWLGIGFLVLVFGLLALSYFIN